MLCERCDHHNATHWINLTNLAGELEDRERVCAECARAAGLAPATATDEPERPYRVIDLDTDRECTYDNLDGARGGIEYDHLVHWQIWHRSELLDERRGSVETR